MNYLSNVEALYQVQQLVSDAVGVGHTLQHVTNQKDGLPLPMDYLSNVNALYQVQQLVPLSHLGIPGPPLLGPETDNQLEHATLVHTGNQLPPSKVGKGIPVHDIHTRDDPVD